MNTRSRFLSYSAGAIAAGVLRYPAGAAEFSYKMGHGQKPTHPLGVRSQQAADNVLKETNGRVEIKVFPDSVLGTDAALVTQLRSKAIELVLIGDNILATTIPVVGISAIPFAFSTHADAWKALDEESPLGSFVRKSIAAPANGIYAFGKKWEVGFRQILNSVRPINSPDDVKGMKIRVPQAPISVALFKTLGATPTPVNGAEMYTALQSHLVDGVDDALPGAEAFKLYEVTKYAAVTNHAWTGYYMVANSESWQALPGNLRTIVEKNFNDAAVLERNDIARLEMTVQTTMKGQGVSFTQPDSAPFRAVVKNAGLYGQWRDSFGHDAWALLERVTKLTA